MPVIYTLEQLVMHDQRQIMCSKALNKSTCTYRDNHCHRQRRSQAEGDGEGYPLHTKLASQSGEVITQARAGYLHHEWKVSVPLLPAIHVSRCADNSLLDATSSSVGQRAVLRFYRHV